ncbi:MAG: tail fiber domain-containing protein [Candidatus Omnitrophota bacterium]|nr:tail fiber domain-containing protein [Candidatus Omnitrophota bacterium]
MRKNITVIRITLFFTFALFSLAFSQEESFTITTYYPSPYGSYNELTTTGNTYLAITSGGSVGIGTAIPGYKLHVIGDAAKTVGGTAWVDASDVRLKNVLGEIGPVLGKVKQLRPIKYTWNELRRKKFGASDGGIKYGFVAQEMKNVFPEFISEGPEGYLMYNPSGYEAILTEAIQDLIKEIEELKSEVNVLKARLSSSTSQRN